MSAEPVVQMKPKFDDLLGAADVQAIEALTGAGLAARTADNTWALRTLTAGSGISITDGNGVSGNPTISSTASGTVTSVALSLPSIITVSGSPVTTSGTLTGTLATQTANTVFSGPTSGGAATPAFRALVADDIPNISAAKITSGTLDAARLPTHTHSAADITSGTLVVGRGGTGITTTPANGQIPIGNGTNYTAATITAGSGITVTNSSGGIAIAATGGAATAVNHLINGDFAVFQRGTGTATCTANSTSGSAVLTSVSSVAGFSVGQGINGGAVAAGATVASIDSATQITMSAAAVATATGTTVSTGTYDNMFCGADRWLVLGQSTTGIAGLGTNASPGLTVVKSNSGGRLGICQWMDFKTTRLLRGKTMVFQIDCASSGTDTMRVAILEWTGTADTLGSARDPVNDWTSGTFTAGNFFKSTTQNVIATGSASVTSRTTLSCSGSIGSSANNICVMVWADSAASTNDLTFTDAEMFEGASSRSPQPVDPAVSLTRCERFYYKTLAGTQQPVVAVGNNQGAERFYTSYATGGFATKFRQRMHRAPTVVVYNPIGSSTGTVRDTTNSADRTAAVGVANDTGVFVGITTASTSAEHTFHLTADAEIA